ncbi:serine/threonine-protein kinase [Stratiformator vulcanicus]|uniref:Serine/threonine-protein kinase PknD n=1 Tax=Stratiformator vulcanicus TaxID=2527980 RepID=A0A517R1H7_9PLAN|nr:serine/threonine-protein kinase [Stratiformator vulcanicus]QDT37714.1 Serine/threonine-protein kinase PknD [Stratiformator vulcanicus]
MTEDHASSSQGTQGNPDFGDTVAPVPSTSHSTATGGEQLDATFVVQGGVEVDEFGAGTKQERDIAFGVTALESGKVTERQIAKAVSDWTIHGHESLAGHLMGKGLLDPAVRQELEASAATRLKNVGNSIAPADRLSASGLGSLLLVDRLDKQGRVSKLLGIANSAAVTIDDDSRRLNSRFRLLRKLGQGGLGTVWLASDESLRRLVAIKEINPAAQHDEAAIARFKREAEVTGRLEHPGIVPIYQFGTDESTERYFYVMRFLGKQTLQDAIAEYHERREAGHHDPMDLHRLLTAFVSICQSVAHAHSRKIIHRDLKPENVALDNFGQVVLLDWGLAKLNDETGLFELAGSMSSDDPHDSGATVAGQVLGTPMYMAPEQAAGRIDEIDERTDVFGLGAILFAILTGAAPHERSREAASAAGRMAELFSSIVSDPVPDPLLYDPELPADLRAICMKAIAKKRYLRYETAEALADDIQRQMAGEPVRAYEEPASKRIQRWIGDHPRLSQALGVVAAILLAIVFLAAVKTYQDGVTAERDRFAAIKADVREMEINLRSDADDLSKAVRFMSDLPPIGALIDLENQRASADAAEGRDVWRRRLGSIYSGLLKSTPTCLSVTFGKVDEVTFDEIVRVERGSFAGGIPQVLPESRLASFPIDKAGLLVRSLKPGEVLVLDRTVLTVPEAVFSRDHLVLVAGTPIYDQATGEVFGIVAIESNLERMVRELISRVVRPTERVLVLDSKNHVRIDYQEATGFREIPEQVRGEAVVPALDGFLKQTVDTEFSDKRDIYAVKIRFDPRQPDSVITLVLMNAEG